LPFPIRFFFGAMLLAIGGYIKWHSGSSINGDVGRA
jgi:hypothetical protein